MSGAVEVPIAGEVLPLDAGDWLADSSVLTTCAPEGAVVPCGASEAVELAAPDSLLLSVAGSMIGRETCVAALLVCTSAPIVCAGLASDNGIGGTG